MTEIVKINYCRRILIQVSLIAALVIMLGLAAESSFAAKTTYGDYEVESVRESGGYSARIIGYNGKDADLVFPDSALSEPIVFNQYISASKITGIEMSLTGSQKASIRSVSVPEGYASISGFDGCTALENVNLPASITQISPYAFKGCTALESVAFADGASAVNLGLQSFSGCTSLRRITLPAGVTTTNGMNVFFGSTSLEEIQIPNGENYFSVDGIMYCKNGDAAKLVAYPEGKSTAKLTLPEKAGELAVTNTGLHAFRNNKTLEEVIIPASYKTVGSCAFNGCSNLKKITISSDEFSIDGNYSYAFQDIADGSVIYVANEDIKAALEANTGFYTQEKTTFDIIVNEVPNRFDVNGDGEVDILDLTTAQMHYQADSNAETWPEASKSDVNEDGVININDLIAIYAEIYKVQYGIKQEN